MFNNIVLTVGLVIIATSNFSVAQNLIKYTPSAVPLLKVASPKPNLYISMSNDTNIANSNLTDKLMTVPEHYLGPGQPICEVRQGELAIEWAAIKANYSNVGVKGGYYDPFGTGSYVPYLKEVIGDTEYEKYIDTIPIERCKAIYPASIYVELFPQILQKYSQRANIGFGGYGSSALPKYRNRWFRNENPAKEMGGGFAIRDFCPVGTYCKYLGYFYDAFKYSLYMGKDGDQAKAANDYREVGKIQDHIYYDVFMQPITDMSKYTPDDWQEVDKKIRYKILGEYDHPSTKQKEYVLGVTNTYNVLYNLSLYFRGYPMVEKGYAGTGYVFDNGTPFNRYTLKAITVKPSPWNGNPFSYTIFIVAYLLIDTLLALNNPMLNAI